MGLLRNPTRDTENKATQRTAAAPRQSRARGRRSARGQHPCHVPIPSRAPPSTNYSREKAANDKAAAVSCKHRPSRPHLAH